ncbi:hypothetical protein BDY21DRAFT_72818 [Lineolata rhizophorae]|uniref:Uncharacterized protein n=1 Tax=Lineolata rhizophorae TaxID=578093 RepID=A0A6A6NUN4_9PEZI|nr:hypothetical protein BDY21DRAFT_72818 [Lineolata rhizophorae]
MRCTPLSFSSFPLALRSRFPRATSTRPSRGECAEAHSSRAVGIPDERKGLPPFGRGPLPVVVAAAAGVDRQRGRTCKPRAPLGACGGRGDGGGLLVRRCVRIGRPSGSSRGCDSRWRLQGTSPKKVPRGERRSRTDGRADGFSSPSRSRDGELFTYVPVARGKVLSGKVARSRPRIGKGGGGNSWVEIYKKNSRRSRGRVADCCQLGVGRYLAKMRKVRDHRGTEGVRSIPSTYLRKSHRAERFAAVGMYLGRARATFTCRPVGRC